MNKKVTIVFLIILTPIALYFWPAFLGGDTEFLIVQGQSMFPTILPGSLVITKKAPEYHIDDIVSYKETEEGASKIIVHRIIGESDRGFIIQGDNNAVTDSGTPTSKEIRGEVIFSTPYFGDALQLFRNPVVLLGGIIVMGLIQYEQKRRKTMKEKIRRIRLGLPPTLERQNKPQKPQKPNYTPFLGAIVINVLAYVLLQVSLGYNLKPKGDMVTGFLYNILEPSFASTITFGMYLVFIFGLYFVAKSKDKKSQKSLISSRRHKSLELIMGKNFSPVLSVCQFVCVIFIIMSLLHIAAIGTDIIQAVTCDPTTELCPT